MKIIIKKEAPKVLSSGQYIVGQDIPADRYRATNIGEGSNFFVYDENGEAIVNIILGDSSTGGSGDYVFFCDDGNIIQTEAQVKLIPVERSIRREVLLREISVGIFFSIFHFIKQIFDMFISTEADLCFCFFMYLST